MSLPPLARQRAEHLLIPLCARRSPADLREKVRVSFSITGNQIAIQEHRTCRDDPRTWSAMDIAILDYDAESSTWELFCFDRDSRRISYSPTIPTADLDALIATIDTDSSGIFWG